MFKLYRLIFQPIMQVAPPLELERFLRKNIRAVYFLQNLAIHFYNYYKYNTSTSPEINQA